MLLLQSALTILGSRLTYIIMGSLALVCLWFYGQNMKHERDKALADLFVQEQIVAMQTNTIAVIEQTNENLNARIAQTHTFEEEKLANVTEENDGPISPIMRDTLDFMRHRGEGSSTAHP